MSHLVKCSVCGESFDRDKIQAVRSGARRYAHQSCLPTGELVPLVEKKIKQKQEEDPDLKQLKDYINKLYGDKANWSLITRQIKEFRTKYNYSYSGMLKSLVWFHEVQGNSIENSLEKSHGGLGIVPFCYNDAFNYYYSLFLAQSINNNKNIKEIITKEKEIIIPTPQVKTIKHLFSFLDEDIEEEE